MVTRPLLSVLSLALLGALAAPGCASAPFSGRISQEDEGGSGFFDPAESPPLTKDDLQDFQRRLTATVRQELREAGTPAEIKEVTITHAERTSDGGVKLDYHLAYETKDPQSGDVTHQLDSRATVVRDIFRTSDIDTATVWRLVEVAPPEQMLVFHDPLVIGTPPHEAPHEGP